MESKVGTFVAGKLSDRISFLRRQAVGLEVSSKSKDSWNISYFVRIHCGAYAVGKTLSETLSLAETRYKGVNKKISTIESARYKVAILFLNVNDAVAFIEGGVARPFAEIMSEEDIWQDTAKTLNLTRKELVEVMHSSYIILPEKIWMEYSKLALNR